MNISRYLISIFLFSVMSFIYAADAKMPILSTNQQKIKKIVYIVSDINIPFWQIMSHGIKKNAHELGYDFEIYNSNNLAKNELELTIKAIKEKVAGIIVSPTNSSACVTILKLAKAANIPVVISDIGTDKGEYVSYISSNNFEGAYNIGKILTQEMIEKNWQNGTVGIIAIPQKRINGQQRTAGFMKALDEAHIKGADIKQIKEWTDEENYRYAKEFIQRYTNLRAIWLQSSSTYKGILKAINEAGKKNEIIFLSFDAEPEFLNLIPKGEILAAAMQQPYLMGYEAVKAMHKHLNKLAVQKNIQLPILAISSKNIENKLPQIKLNVLGIEEK